MQAPGLTPRAVLEKLAGIQMLDVSFPTTDGRRLVMPRYTEPNPEQALLLHQLNLVLPQQPPPRISTDTSSVVFPSLKCSGDLCSAFVENKANSGVRSAELRRFGQCGPPSGVVGHQKT